MKDTKEARYLIVIPVTGGPAIAAQEIERKSGKIKMKGPAIITNSPDGIGFVFTPLKYLREPVFHEAALLCEEVMPEEILNAYRQWRKL